jgi:hypothetical protein
MESILEFKPKKRKVLGDVSTVVVYLRRKGSSSR